MQDANVSPSGNTWSPFDEEGFASAAYSALENSPLKLARRLRSEGISREFWKRLSLPDTTAPPKQQAAYSEMDLLRLFAAIADRAQVPSLADPVGLPRGSPLDYSNGPIIDVHALSTFHGPVSPLLLGHRSQCRHRSSDKADLFKNASCAPESNYSSRESSLERPFLLTDSRQSSTHVMALDGCSSPDDNHPSPLHSMPMPAGLQTYSPSESASEMRLSITHQPNLLTSLAKSDGLIESSAQAEDCLKSPNSRSPQAAVEPAIAYAHTRTAGLQERSISARKQSSEESRESNGSTSSVVDASTSSSAIVDWSHSLT